MSPLPQHKLAQQEMFLKSLKKAAPAEKARIVLENSGLAAAIQDSRNAVSIRFAK